MNNFNNGPKRSFGDGNSSGSSGSSGPRRFGNSGGQRSFGSRGSSGPRRFGNSGSQRSFGGSRGGSGGFNSSFEPREMHKATCSKCGKECEVPFKPIEGKPVFCKECYVKKKF